MAHHHVTLPRCVWLGQALVKIPPFVQMADADDAAEHNYDSVDGVAKLSSSERYTSVMQVCSLIHTSRARPVSRQETSA